MNIGLRVKNEEKIILYSERCEECMYKGINLITLLHSQGSLPAVITIHYSDFKESYIFGKGQFIARITLPHFLWVNPKSRAESKWDKTPMPQDLAEIVVKLLEEKGLEEKFMLMAGEKE